ncbi:MAG: hypothetical protein U0T75_12140 [Chitinophagales bacterium]
MKLFPENVSTYGGQIDHLFYLILIFVAIAFFISLFVLFYPLVRYHSSNNKKASYITGESSKHFRWITYALVALALSDFVILFAEHDTWETIENVPAKVDVMNIVTGRQWNWIFTYPGPDGKLYTADDVVVDEIDGALHVPVNKNILFDLRSKDVLHSFFVANSRLKQDVIPGRTNTRWINFTKEGKYDISCAEICGSMHGRMRNFIVVESQEKYEQFLQDLYSKNAK